MLTAASENTNGSEIGNHKTMTLKEAILKSLEDIGNPCTNSEVYNHIITHGYYDFKEAQTPSSSVSSDLGSFIRNGDTRVKRIKLNGGMYSYYLTKNEEYVGFDALPNVVDESFAKKSTTKTYDERDLHRLLSSYLKNTSIYSKTIFHEQSSNGKDSNQIWTHPDMVGIRFLNLRTTASQNFLKSINRLDTFQMSSYELKKEINTDSELKKAFFQAVSNSSWANYGYLVAFEISDSLADEMERLNQSFGIGIIELNANPFKSKVLYPATNRKLDFKTIDKLCYINRYFSQFIEQTEKLMTAEERYHKALEKELDEFCDSCLTNDSDIELYCRERNIPYE